MTVVVTIEAENPATRSTTFRVSVNGVLVATDLKAHEANTIVGKSLHRLAAPRKLKLPKTALLARSDNAERAA
jgi:hypothetical protein